MRNRLHKFTIQYSLLVLKELALHSTGTGISKLLSCYWLARCFRPLDLFHIRWIYSSIKDKGCHHVLWTVELELQKMLRALHN